MSRRIPLWATLIPLVLGVILWGWMWRDYAARFRNELQAAAPAGTDVSVGGFPYRLEARIPDVKAALDAGVLQGSLQVRELAVNRVPWQADRQVLNLDQSAAELRLAPIPGANVRVEAEEAQASLHLDGGNIARLSIVWENPRISTGLLPVPLSAGHFEAHLRETPATEVATDVGTGAPPPTQAQVVLSGNAVRFGEGSPLTLALDSELTGLAPLKSYARWAAGGATEIRSATLTDETGEVARLTATLRPDGNGALMLKGQVETVCPASVRAVIAGEPQPTEKRSRTVQTIELSGRLPGGVVASPADPTKPPPPVRGQEPACPKLR